MSRTQVLEKGALDSTSRWAFMLVALLTLGSSGALAQQVVFTSDTLIACEDLSYEGFDVIVDGAIVAIDCEHHFRSLVVRNGGIVTYTPGLLAGMRLVIEQDVQIDLSAGLDVTALGYRNEQGPGAGLPDEDGSAIGGGHGGRGGSLLPADRIGDSYGSVFAPDTPGSGGGGDTGGFGGGLIQLEVGGSIVLDGIVSASGQSAFSDGGGGAGDARAPRH